MNRRMLLGALAASPFGARAQTAKPPRRVALSLGGVSNSAAGAIYLAAMKQTLAARGWVEGRDIVYDVRYLNDPSIEQAREIARGVIAAGPDAVFANGTPGAFAFKLEARTIPIIFANASDPLSSGLVQSLAHPGGNVTGFTNFEFPIAGKWLEFLTEIAPGVERVVVLMPAANPASDGFLRAIQSVAPRRKVMIEAARIRDMADYKTAITALPAGGKTGVVVLPFRIPADTPEILVEQARAKLIPVIYPQKHFVEAGGLMSYASEPVSIYRQAATYLDRVLRGEKAADLPVQAPRKYDLKINLKTAREIGLVVPNTLLVFADEVIE